LGELAKLLIPQHPKTQTAATDIVWTGSEHLLDVLQQKKIKPLIAQRFPLAEASRSVTGKIVLVCGGQ